MTPQSGMPTYYVLRIGGHLDASWQTCFAGLTLSHEADGTTTLRGDVADQAALHGLLGQIRDLGITLLAVEAPEHRPLRKES